MSAFFQWEQELRRLAFLTNTQSTTRSVLWRATGPRALRYGPSRALTGPGLPRAEPTGLRAQALRLTGLLRASTGLRALRALRAYGPAGLTGLTGPTGPTGLTGPRAYGPSGPTGSLRPVVGLWSGYAMHAERDRRRMREILRDKIKIKEVCTRK